MMLLNQPAENADLWVGICGPLTIRRRGKEFRTLPASQRVVAGLLALAEGRAVSPDTIAAALWPDKDPPASAPGIVQTYVSRLRPIFKTGRGSLITRDSTGYRLRLSQAQFDLTAFRILVASARQAQDIKQACDDFERAMRLWRGHPLEDVSLLHDHPAVTALMDECVNVMLEFAAKAAGAGLHEMTLPHLKALAARNPLEERLHASLMIALAGCGRQAEALRTHEELRRRLDEELGVSPSDPVRKAHQFVLRHEAGVSPVTWRSVHQLPAAPAGFTGREAELDAVIGAITATSGHRGVPVAAVSGQPGIGKTALALHAAHMVSGDFPDGQLWVQLAGASARPREPGEVVGEILRVLGVPGPEIPDDHAERPGMLRSVLAERKVLILADDAASVSQVEPLVPGTPGCALIFTSRSQLHGLPGAKHVTLEALPTQQAVSFLAWLAGAERCTADPQAAAKLAEACAGLPLALQIVGGKLATHPRWPLSVMVRKLARADGRLAELQVGSISVAASIASSYATLAERHQVAFRRLALLGPADFPAWVVPVLLGEPDAECVLDDLVTHSLVAPGGIDANGEPRYRLHDLLRAFATRELAADPTMNTNSALERLLSAWLQLARSADAKLPPEPYFPPIAPSDSPSILAHDLVAELTANPIAWFTAERINLQTAVEHACDHGQMVLAYQIAACHCSYHHYQDRHDDAELLWRGVAASATNPVAAVWAELRIAASLNERGRAADAFPLLERCVQLAKQGADPELLAFAMYWRGTCASDLDDHEGTRAAAVLGLNAARTARSRLGELVNLRVLSVGLANTGSFEPGITAGEQALRIASDLGAASYELEVLHALAHTCDIARKFDRAARFSRRGIELSRELGDVRGEALASGMLGDAYHGLAEYQLAIDSLLHALRIFRTHKASHHQAVCCLKLGYAYQAIGRNDEARSYLEESRETFGRLRLPSRVEMAQQALDRLRLTAPPRSDG